MGFLKFTRNHRENPFLHKLGKMHLSVFFVFNFDIYLLENDSLSVFHLLAYFSRSLVREFLSQYRLDVKNHTFAFNHSIQYIA